MLQLFESANLRRDGASQIVGAEQEGRKLREFADLRWDGPGQLVVLYSR